MATAACRLAKADHFLRRARPPPPLNPYRLTAGLCV